MEAQEEDFPALDPFCYIDCCELALSWKAGGWEAEAGEGEGRWGWEQHGEEKKDGEGCGVEGFVPTFQSVILVVL